MVTEARSPFDLLPAMDLRGGRVVRLEQGDFERETAYSTDPASVAEAFVEAGAPWLHVVDLDGARAGVPRHIEAVRAVITAVGERSAIEVAGGLRDTRSADAMLGLGARRIVLGTAAIREPDFAADLVRRHGPARVAVALDVREGGVMGHGWLGPASEADPAQTLLRLAGAGIGTFEVTAIDRDGLLTGPDLALLERLVRLDAGDVVASGGIASLDDLRAVRAIGCRGAIVGRALYEHRLDLAEAVRWASGGLREAADDEGAAGTADQPGRPP